MAMTLKDALSEKTAADIPTYDRASTGIGIVHLGAGAFFRGHQAVYTDDVLNLNGGDWGICGVSLRSTGVRDMLGPQDGLYTLATLDQDISYRIIGALKEILVAPEEPAAVLARLCEPSVKIVTLTITEKGYCLSPDGTLDRENADIAHDIDHPDSPRSAIGYLVAGLAARKAAGTDAFTCLSCDNLPDNGHKLKAAVLGLAAEHDGELADWIVGHASFPRTMVDSITPATDDALIERVREEAGLEDAWPIQREAFKQWVIEEFNAPRPAWEKAGATFTNDVPAFEHAKLRLLNAPHSALAYLGPLAGHETVKDAIGDETFEQFIRKMTDEEIMPGLTAPQGLDLTSYRDAIIARFHNPEIRHLLSQIAWDGTQKLPVRIISVIRENLNHDRPIVRLCMALAAWRLFVINMVGAGKTITDPKAGELAGLGWSTEEAPKVAAQQLLGYRPLFDDALASDPKLEAALTSAIDRLGDGSAQTVRQGMSV